MKTSFVPWCLAFIALACASLAAAGQQAESRVSPRPLTAERLAVYRAVLHGWMENEVRVVNLSDKTVPIQTSGLMSAEGCDKGLDLEPVSPSLIHRFRTQDLPQLGSDKIVLVDPEQQTKEIAENDPERTIGKGRSIEDAVRNGFEHGLVTLSEIRFSKDHNFAIVAYGFRCGGLCGNGGTAVLEKKDGVWQRKSQCHDWISALTYPIARAILEKTA
jgi:hypothetical protein